MRLKMGTDEANTGRENLLRVFRVSTVTTTRMDRTAARISQGCRNCCQYCARPLIRTGPLSRTVTHYHSPVLELSSHRPYFLPFAVSHSIKPRHGMGRQA